MSERETIISKLRKIEGMLQSPFENERNVAKGMLEELCKKHGVSRADLLGEEMRDFEFTLENTYEKSVLSHVLWQVTGTPQIKNWSKGKKFYAELTVPHGIEAQECFAHYKKELEDILDVATTAFISRNRIFGPADTAPDATIYDQEKIRRIRRMMEGMDSNKWDGVKRLT